MNRQHLAIAVSVTIGLLSTEAWLAVTRGRTMNDGTPGTQTTLAVQKSDAEWQASLTPRQYAILRQHDTEYPGSSPLLGEHRDGTFACAGCGQPLFVSGTKYESGSGWPSFYAAIEGAVGTREDRALGMRRVEIHCSRCGGHLGHVFPDGPRPTGERYCTNGGALTFTPADK